MGELTMKKSRIILLGFTLVIALAFVAGCGSNDTKAPQPQQQQSQQQNAHASHSMPSGDPMPMMKDMEKAMQDMMKQVKAGQTMDAQKSSSLLASTADKLAPHVSDSALQDKFKKVAYDLRDTMNNGKVDPTVVEGKVQALQEVMKQVNANLQSGSHGH